MKLKHIVVNDIIFYPVNSLISGSPRIRNKGPVVELYTYKNYSHKKRGEVRRGIENSVCN